MTVEERILDLVRRTPQLTEAQIAQKLFGGEGYQQRVNSTCRLLLARGDLKRNGLGGAADPFTYTLK